MVMIILASIAVGAAVAGVLFKVFFDSWEDFLDCLRLESTPELLSVFRGEWHERQWAHVKVLFYVGLSGGSGLMTHHSLERLFP